MKASEFKFPPSGGEDDDKKRKFHSMETTEQVMDGLVSMQWSIMPDEIVFIFDPKPKQRDVDYWAEKFSVSSQGNLLTFWSSLSVPYRQQFLDWINEQFP